MKLRKIINEKSLNKLLFIFLIIQPLLDIYILFRPEVVEIIGFSPSTIIRVVFFVILFLMLTFTIKIKKSHFFFVIYGFLILLYTYLHHKHLLNFNSFNATNFNYSLANEMFYIFRMLMPLGMIIISTKFTGDDSKIEKIITWIIILISGSIVLTNLLGISLGSYSKVQISANIFSWFSNNSGYYDLASKGFFNDPNRISALTVLITPIFLYFYYTNPNKKNIILIIIHFLAMFMIGTKVTTIGFIVLNISMLILYLFFSIIKKDLYLNKKILTTTIIITIISFAIIPFTPMYSRTKTDQNISADYESGNNDMKKNEQKLISEIEIELIKLPRVEIDEYDFLKHDVFVIDEVKIIVSKLDSNPILIKFIEENYKKFHIELGFIEYSYSYHDDPYFWYEIMKLPLSSRTNFRFLEQSMLDRVKQINNNQKDNIYGISFTRMSNIFDLERDFLSHYYTLGIIGLLLIMSPYILILIACGIRMLKDYQQKLNFKNCAYALGIGITLFAAFYSGNVMDGLIVTIILGFIYGQLIKNVFSKETTIKFSIIIPSYNDDTSILETLDSLKCQTNSNWEAIIIDDGSTDNTSKVVNKYIKNHKLENKITYIYQENKDQLNAIKNGIKKIKGQYVLILHSDDLLSSHQTLEWARKYLNDYDVDALIGDHIIIDEKTRENGILETKYYKQNRAIPPLMLLWLGRNLYADTTIIKSNVFLNQYKKNYLDWNTPFWIDFDNDYQMLNVRKCNFPLIKYRIHENNYINSEIGNLNVINGELRCVSNLLKKYEIPCYNYQYFLFRIFNKLKLPYYPLYFSRETKNKSDIIENVIKKRFGNDYSNNEFLNSLVNFYKNKCNRSITLSIKQNEVFIGSDMRKFNNLLIKKSLPKVYYQLFNEMNKGFSKVFVKANNKENVEQVLKFLCIYSDVIVEEE